ncbi:MAG: response regulator transcription factor [Phycisphaerae bacterium]
MFQSPIVYVVDDDLSTLKCLRAAFENAHLRVKCYHDGPSFLHDFRAFPAGCLLLDLRLPDMSGLAVIEQLRRHHATFPVIMITGYPDVRAAVHSFKLGAIDFLEKPVDLDNIVSRVQRLLQDELARAEQLQVTRDIQNRLRTLTSREQAVLQLVVQGLSNKMIAADLGITTKTASHHRANLSAKMGASNTADLVRMVVAVDPASFLKSALQHRRSTF